MIDENEIFTRLVADLEAAGINPDKYFEVEPSLDELCLAMQSLYAEQLRDAYTSYAKELRELQEASDNAKKHLLMALQKTQAQVAQRTEQLSSKQ